MADTIRCEVCRANLKATNETSHMRKVHPQVAFEPKATDRSTADRPSFYLSHRTKQALFAGILVVVLVIAATMLLRSAEKGAPLDTSATVVRVSMSGFDPSTITVKAGTPLKIDLINMDNQYHMDGGGWHNLAMDDFAMNMTVEPLGQTVFTVPTGTAGTFGWYCSMCCGGRESPSMNGRVIVEL